MVIVSNDILILNTEEEENNERERGRQGSDNDNDSGKGTRVMNVEIIVKRDGEGAIFEMR